MGALGLSNSPSSTNYPQEIRMEFVVVACNASHFRPELVFVHQLCSRLNNCNDSFTHPWDAFDRDASSMVALGGFNIYYINHCRLPLSQNGRVDFEHEDSLPNKAKPIERRKMLSRMLTVVLSLAALLVSIKGSPNL